MLSKKICAVQEQWGPEFFEPVPADRLKGLPIRQGDGEVLRGIGLPTGPKEALALALRFENIGLGHRPSGVRALVPGDLEKSDLYPKTANPAVDSKTDLRRFVIVGEVARDPEVGALSPPRWICLDGDLGYIWWVYRLPRTVNGAMQIPLFSLNTSLTGYLASLLAYKLWREATEAMIAACPDEETFYEDPSIKTRKHALHTEFVAALKQADPASIELGFDFWNDHAFNEALLMGVA